MHTKYIIERFGIIQCFLKSVFVGLSGSTNHLPINRTQTKVLMFIKHHQMNTMSQISKITGLEKGSFTTAADHLIKLGLIQRIRSETDKRVVSLELTQKGHILTEEMILHADIYIEQILNRLDTKEKEKFIDALDVMANCIQKIQNEGE